MNTHTATAIGKDVSVRPLHETDLATADHLAFRAVLMRRRGVPRALGLGDRPGHRAVRVRRQHHHWERTSGPGVIDEPADPRLTERLGKRSLGRGGQDHGGNGHRGRS